MLTALFAVIVVVAPAQDALFGLIIVFNAVIGTVQELRAKRTLDRLRILNAPTATVVRDGREVTIDPQQIVLDDLVVMRAGDQVLVDGEVVRGDGLEVDESLLTGEADPQARQVGEQVLSGSVVVAGAGWCRASAVGADAYAARLAGEARRYQVVRSELQEGVTQVVRWASIVMVPAGALLIWGQSRAGLGWREAAQRSVAGIVAMVPEGLVLLTSMAFAVGVIRLGRRRCLVKQLAGVEALARVDVICLDKTGTLTSGDMHLTGVEPLAGEQEPDLRTTLAAIAAADPSPNATVAALRRAVDDPPRWEVVDRRPFSSARKWSAVAFRERGWFLLGAPEMLLPAGDPALAPGRRARRSGPAGAAPGPQRRRPAAVDGEASAATAPFATTRRPGHRRARSLPPWWSSRRRCGPTRPRRCATSPSRASP